MLPRWHLFYGALLTIFIALVIPEVESYKLILLFLSSFLIDFDHYINEAWNTRKIGLGSAFAYHRTNAKEERDMHKKGIRTRGEFHIFHTVEFHIIIAILGMIWTPFFYIFIGMAFHSLLDIFDGLRKNRLYRREFFFFNWARKNI